MYQDITRFGISAFGRIKWLASRLLDADGPGAGAIDRSAASRRARRRLARRRSSDARAAELARQVAARRVEHASAAICAAPTLPAARVTMTELGPQLDAAVIGRHCRQVFPAAPVDGVFDDLLARLEACEWRDSGAPLSASAPDITLACVG